MEQVFTVLGWLTLVTLTVGIARQLSSQPTIYQFPDSFGSSYASHGWDKGFLENFQGGQSADDAYTVGALEEDASSAGPVSPVGLLLPAQPATTSANLTAESCYKKDFLAQTQKTGNYIQRTNNFKHARPDSCTSPLTEFVNSVYSPSFSS
jgi:hypothetical protein